MNVSQEFGYKIKTVTHQNYCGRENKNEMDLNQIMDYMTHAECIGKNQIADLIKKYPNDSDLGTAVRKLYYKDTE